MTCRDENPLRGPFSDHRAVEITNSGDRDNDIVSLRLNNEFSSPDWVRIEGNRIHAAVPARLSNSNLATRLRELPLEQLADQMLEILPLHRGKIVFRTNLVQN